MKPHGMSQARARCRECGYEFRVAIFVEKKRRGRYVMSLDSALIREHELEHAEAW